jgi:hypothetical protein
VDAGAAAIGGTRDAGLDAGERVWPDDVFFIEATRSAGFLLACSLPDGGRTSPRMTWEASLSSGTVWAVGCRGSPLQFFERSFTLSPAAQATLVSRLAAMVRVADGPECAEGGASETSIASTARGRVGFADERSCFVLGTFASGLHAAIQVLEDEICPDRGEC